MVCASVAAFVEGDGTAADTGPTVPKGTLWSALGPGRTVIRRV